MAHSESGFTMIELIIASFLALLLMGVLSTFLIQARDLTMETIQSSTFNREARASFSLMANGFHDSGDRLPGIRGSQGSLPANNTGLDPLDNTVLKSIAGKVWIEDGGSFTQHDIELLTSTSDNHLRFKLNNIQYPSADSHYLNAADTALGWLHNAEALPGLQVDGRITMINIKLLHPGDVAGTSPNVDPNDLPQYDLDFMDKNHRIRQSYRTAFYCPGDNWD